MLIIEDFIKKDIPERLDSALGEDTKRDLRDNILSLKGSAWIINLDGKSDGELFEEKIIEENKRIRTEFEFLGKRTDEGFRVSKTFSKAKNVVVITAELAYIIFLFEDLILKFKEYIKKKKYIVFNGERKIGYRKEELERLKEINKKYYSSKNRLLNPKFLGFGKLKGVWKDNYYPVYCIYKGELSYNTALELTNKLVGKNNLIKIKKNVYIGIPDYDYSLELLEKILKDNNLIEDVKMDFKLNDSDIYVDVLGCDTHMLFIDKCY